MSASLYRVLPRHAISTVPAVPHTGHRLQAWHCKERLCTTDRIKTRRLRQLHRTAPFVRAQHGALHTGGVHPPPTSRAHTGAHMTKHGHTNMRSFGRFHQKTSTKQTNLKKETLARCYVQCAIEMCYCRIMASPVHCVVQFNNQLYAFQPLWGLAKSREC